MTEIGGSNTRVAIAVPGRQNDQVVLSWGATTHTGKRRAANEDSFVAKLPLFAVADGMGGHTAGDLASAAVVERLAEVVSGEFLSAHAIERALQCATDDIARIAGDSELGVGTTVTGIALSMTGDQPVFAVFNIGDSRVYAFDDNGLAQVTVDHSVVQELVAAGTLTRQEAENHPDSNIITRAVGFHARPVPDLWMLPLRAGMRLLVCSDGLTKEVGDERIRLHLAAGLAPAETAAALIDAALAEGGRDNITTIVVDVIEAPDSPEAEGLASSSQLRP